MSDRNFTMLLEFDVHQVTRSLNYKFFDDEGSIFQDTGRCAGAFHFGDGGTLDIKVIAHAKEADEASYEITDFTLTSVPTQTEGTGYLSIFDPERACSHVEKWSQTKSKGDGDIILVSKAKNSLNIGKSNGQWSISGYLSVIVSKLNKDGEMVKTPRLFYFDPEGTTGTGGDLPD